MGWLLAKPEGQDETRLSLYGETVPELPPTERLADLWQALGYAQQGFSGPVPFVWSEIMAFDRMASANLAPHEATCLIEMSKAYCNEVADSNPLRKSPMERDSDD